MGLSCVLNILGLRCMLTAYWNSPGAGGHQIEGSQDRWGWR